MRTAAFLSGLALAVLLGAAPALAASPAHVRGTVTSLAGSSLTVTTAGGPVRLALTAKTTVVGVVPARLDDVKPGTFVGIANVPGGGAARALEVVVFPDAMRGTGEGDYPWDLSAAGHGSSAMTNGTVAGGSMKSSSMTNGTVSSGSSMGGSSMSGSSMTNATVSKVAGGAQRTISVAYKGGTKQIVIPASVPVVRVVPGSKTLLVAGTHVFVIPDAAHHAAFVVVGEHGAIPPM